MLVRFHPGAPRGRGRSARHFVANEDQAGSNPVVRSKRPRSTKVVRLFRNPQVSVRFRPRARSRRSFQRSKTALRSAVNRGGAGSNPAAGAARARPTGEASAFQAVPGEFDSRRPLAARALRRVLPAGRGIRALNPATRVRFPHTTPTPSSNGSGSEITNLRMTVRVRPESHV